MERSVEAVKLLFTGRSDLYITKAVAEFIEGFPKIDPDKQKENELANRLQQMVHKFGFDPKLNPAVRQEYGKAIRIDGGGKIRIAGFHITRNQKRWCFVAIDAFEKHGGKNNEEEKAHYKAIDKVAREMLYRFVVKFE